MKTEAGKRISAVSRQKCYRSGNMIRMVVLGVVLLMVGGGAIYEFGVNLPGYRNAMQSLDSISKQNMTAGKTRTDVEESLGGRSADTEFSKMEFQGEGKKTVRFQRKDHYKWSRLIPGKKNLEVFVIYERILDGDEAENASPESFEDSQWAFKSYFEPGNAPVTATVQARKRPMEDVLFDLLDEDVDGFVLKTDLVKDSTILKQMELFDPNGDDKISFEEFKKALETLEKKKGEPLSRAEQYAFVGGQSPGEGGAPVVGGNPDSGNPGGGNPGGGKPGSKPGGQKRSGKPGGGFDLGSFFDRMDQDNNGKLSADEIPDRMKARVGDIDKDGDQEISKEEFLNAPRSPRGGSPRGGQQPGDQGQRGASKGGAARNASGENRAEAGSSSEKETTEKEKAE
ncbi:MAG: EF-hand domain-containing protein [Planctomycetota bacterium]|nr:EF-hand domain-containing protein [Planctomycetota bacterium]